MPFYEVVLEGQLDSEPMLHVLHYQITGSTDMQAFCDAIDNELEAGLMAELVPSARYNGITIREDIPGSIGVPYSFTGGAALGGNGVGSYFGLVAALVRKLTGSTTKPTQGRIFQSGIPTNAANDDGFLLPARQAAIAAGWENLRVITFDGTGEAVMQVKATNPLAPNTVPYNPVASLDCRGRFSRQVRRNYNTP